MDDQHIIDNRDQAWKAFADFDALTWYPRFYKKRGRKNPYINPFRDMDEYNRLAAERRHLWREFLSAQFAVYDAGLSAPLTVEWIREDTPDGERWRRV